MHLSVPGMQPGPALHECNQCPLFWRASYQPISAGAGLITPGLNTENYGVCPRNFRRTPSLTHCTQARCLSDSRAHNSFQVILSQALEFWEPLSALSPWLSMELLRKEFLLQALQTLRPASLHVSFLIPLHLKTLWSSLATPSQLSWYPGHL